MSETKLLNCPFCGGEVITLESHASNSMWFVQCDNESCLATFPFFDTKEEAIKAWNTRVPMERIMKQLEERKETCNGHKCEKDGCAGCVDCKIESSYAEAIEILNEEGGIE